MTYSVVTTSEATHEAQVTMVELMLAKARIFGDSTGAEIWARRQDDGTGQIAFNPAARTLLASFVERLDAKDAGDDVQPGEGWTALHA